MELNILDFNAKIQVIESNPILGPVLANLKQFQDYHRPFAKVNFLYNKSFFGNIEIIKHLDEFANNNYINFSMLKDIKLINGTEKVFLDKDQSEMYKLFIRRCASLLEKQNKINNEIIEESHQF